MKLQPLDFRIRTPLKDVFYFKYCANGQWAAFSEQYLNLNAFCVSDWAGKGHFTAEEIERRIPTVWIFLGYVYVDPIDTLIDEVCE